METKHGRRSTSRAIAAAGLAAALAGPAAAQVTSQVSFDVNGAQPNKDSYGGTISTDGRYVGFFCYDDLMDFGSGLLGVHSDVYLRDRWTGVLERISVSSNEVQGDDYSYGPALSADVRYAVFSSYSGNLVPGDTNGPYPTGHDVFVRDRQLGTTERVSVDSAGIQGDGPGTWDYCPPISPDGRYVSFASESTNLVPGDTNGVADVFLRDRFGGPDFTSFCVPGAAGVIACPCSNPSGGFGQGCDNSAATGGALLTASGGAYVSSDSLVFTTLGEKPTALSIVWQGPTSSAVGSVFGQGVRCVGGTLKRLYHKNAVGGSITAPDFAAGDLTVSARSAAVNVPIQAGETRYYFVSYRDAVVLGGCPSVATFNATQAGGVTWSP